MASSRSEWFWLAGRMATLTVMAVVVFVSAMVLWGRFEADLELPIAGRDRLSWMDLSEVPLGALVLSGDVDENVQDYIPLLGYVWWLGPLSLGLFLAVGLAVVYYSRHPRVPGSYLTPRIAAVGVAIAGFGAAAWPLFSCVMYEWNRLGVPLTPFGGTPGTDPGCAYGLDRLRERRGVASG